MKSELEIEAELKRTLSLRAKMKRNWAMRITKLETPALDSSIATLRWVLRSDKKKKIINEN
jgi:hypothetical protein